MEERARMHSCAALVMVTRPAKMNVECRAGLQDALRNFDSIDNGSHVHIDHEYVCLYSTRLLVQIQLAQFRHRTIRFRYVCNGARGKQNP